MSFLNFEVGAKKAAIPVKPNDTIAEALNVFCNKFSLPGAAHWQVLNGRKEVDISLTIRLSGLPNLAKLSLVRKAGGSIEEVTVALQTSSARHVSKFPNNTTLWDILKHWEGQASLNITTDGGVPPDCKNAVKVYLQPTILYTNKEVKTNSELRGTTLADLGLTSGNGVLRLLHKYTTIPLDEFLKMDDQSSVQEKGLLEKQLQEKKETQTKKEEEEKRLKELEAERIKIFAKQEEEAKFMKEKNQAAVASLETEAKAKQEKTQKMLVDAERRQQQQQEEEAKFYEMKLKEEQERLIQRQKLEYQRKLESERLITQMIRKEEEERRRKEEQVVPVDRNPEVFAPSTSAFDPHSIEIPDDFYDVTFDDLKVNAAIMKQKKKEDEGLKTKQMRDRERVQKLSKYKKCFIRVRFPDRVELQAIFNPLEKPLQLYSFVRESLADQNQSVPFYLYTIPPKTAIAENLNTNLRDLGFLPAALVHFAIEEGNSMHSPFLKDTLIHNIKEKLPPPQVVVPKSDQVIVSPSPVDVKEKHNVQTEKDMDIVKKEEQVPSNGGGAPPIQEKKVPSWFSKGKK